MSAPAPWVFNDRDGYVVDADGYAVAEIMAGYNDEEQMKVAQLIASAPNLLEERDRLRAMLKKIYEYARFPYRDLTDAEWEEANTLAFKTLPTKTAAAYIRELEAENSTLIEACKSAYKFQCGVVDCRAYSKQVNHDFCQFHRTLFDAVSKHGTIR